MLKMASGLVLALLASGTAAAADKMICPRFYMGLGLAAGQGFAYKTTHSRSSALKRGRSTSSLPAPRPRSRSGSPARDANS
jgi:hypothetical protein